LMKNEMQIGARGIKNVLVIMVLKRKETLKWQILEKTPLHSSLLENCLSIFQFGIVIQKYDLWKLKELYLNQLQLIIVSKIKYGVYVMCNSY
jgi:hypothetical protein